MNDNVTTSKLQERRTANAIMDYIVVPALPRKALVEWQVWIHTHNNKFECKRSFIIIRHVEARTLIRPFIYR